MDVSPKGTPIRDATVIMAVAYQVSRDMNALHRAESRMRRDAEKSGRCATGPVAKGSLVALGELPEDLRLLAQLPQDLHQELLRHGVSVAQDRNRRIALRWSGPSFLLSHLNHLLKSRQLRSRLTRSIPRARQANAPHAVEFVQRSDVPFPMVSRLKRPGGAQARHRRQLARWLSLRKFL
jgi:hypothetical protein